MISTNNHALSRHEPRRNVSVSSQVCTPGSRRIV